LISVHHHTKEIQSLSIKLTTLLIYDLFIFSININIQHYDGEQEFIFWFVLGFESLFSILEE